MLIRTVIYTNKKIMATIKSCQIGLTTGLIMLMKALITETGNEVLSKNAIKTVADIEALMQKWMNQLSL